MGAWSAGDATADPISACTDAGIDLATARMWRRAAQFAAGHPALESAWLDGAITARQVGIVATGTRRLDSARQAVVIEAISPVLPGLTPAETSVVVEGAADAADPRDTRETERDDHADRRLDLTGIGGGVDISGYLPAAEAGALLDAIAAMVEDLRAQDDGLTATQRRADALAAIIAKAAAHGLPTGGGLPVAVTLTISATEAQRIAAIDPNRTSPRVGPFGAATAGHTTATVGDATARFALCCATITPAHHHSAPEPGSLLARFGAGPLRPLQLGRDVRLATAAQRKALRLRDRGCAAPGCRIASGYTQPHHITPWSLGGATDLSNMISLCWAHHRQVEHGHWDIRPAPPGSPRPFTITRNRR